MSKPIKSCVDPVFFGTAVHYEDKEGQSFKASKLKRVAPIRKGSRYVEFETQNSLYVAAFTSTKRRQAFLDTSHVLGLLDDEMV